MTTSDEKNTEGSLRDATCENEKCAHYLDERNVKFWRNRQTLWGEVLAH